LNFLEIRIDPYFQTLSRYTTMVRSENQFCIKKNKQFKEENKHIQLIDEKNVLKKKATSYSMHSRGMFIQLISKKS